jgi:Glycosyl transferase family 2
MEDKKLACAITMVKDDYFFLERWVRYYGDLFGRDSLYVISHGGDPKVAEIAAGANVIAIPGVFNEKFDAVRWRLLGNLGNGLRGYYNFILIGDVDEFVVFDPKTGMTLAEFLGKRRGKSVITPIGLEVVHKPELEPETVDNRMLGPRRYVRFSSAYSKPCLFNQPVSLSRGGHFSKDPDLKLFRHLYLFHMRFVDENLYVGTLARRQAQVDTIDNSSADTMISWNWRRDTPQGDPFLRASSLPIVEDFDLSDDVKLLDDSWGPREQTGYYGSDKNIGGKLHTLPDRFFGLL